MTQYRYVSSIISTTSYWEVKGVEPKMEPLMLQWCTQVLQQATTSNNCVIFIVWILEYLATRSQFDFVVKEANKRYNTVTSKICKHGSNHTLDYCYLYYGTCIWLLVVEVWWIECIYYSVFFICYFFKTGRKMHTL